MPKSFLINEKGINVFYISYKLTITLVLTGTVHKFTDMLRVNACSACIASFDLFNKRQSARHRYV